MHAISVKELRENLPMVRRQLKKGKAFLIIFQSKPLAKLIPVQENMHFEEANDQEVEAASLNDLGQDFLSKKELDYYLKLKC